MKLLIFILSISCHNLISLDKTYLYELTIINKSKNIINIDFQLFGKLIGYNINNIKSIKLLKRNGNFISSFTIKDIESKVEKRVSLKVKHPQLEYQPYNNKLDLMFLALDNEFLKKISLNFNSDKEIIKIKKIYTFVKNYIKKSSYNEVDMGTLYVLKYKKGDCTEYASLLASLFRLNNIKYRVVGGYYLKKLNQYHSWIEVLIDNKWVILDPINNNFNPSSRNYISVEMYYWKNVHKFKSHSKGSYKATLKLIY